MTCRSALGLVVWAGAVACTTDTGVLGRGDAGVAPDAAVVRDAGQPAIDAGSLSELGEALLAADCAFMARCTPYPFHESFGDRSSCIDSGGRMFSEDVVARVEAGRARIDPEAFAECLALYENGDCTSSATWLACDSILIGMVPRGAACTARYECVPGLVCSGYVGFVGCGVCVDPVPIGTTCDAWAPNACESGICYTQIAGTPGVCSPRDLREGEPCSGNYSECAPPLYCDRSDPGDRRCRAPVRPGEPCTQDFIGPRCDFAWGRCEDGICEPYVLAEAGEPCDLLNACEGVCAQSVCGPRIELGDMCDTTDGLCAGGRGLCLADAVCRPRPAEGDPCNLDRECGRGRACAGEPKRCTVRGWEHCR